MNSCKFQAPFLLQKTTVHLPSRTYFTGIVQIVLGHGYVWTFCRVRFPIDFHVWKLLHLELLDKLHLFGGM